MLSQKKDYAWIMQALVFAIYICISHANVITTACKAGKWIPGDGNGRIEKNLGNVNTHDECIALVQSKEPDANAATLLPGGKGPCYAEFGATHVAGGFTNSIFCLFVKDKCEAKDCPASKAPKDKFADIVCSGKTCTESECCDDKTCKNGGANFKPVTCGSAFTVKGGSTKCTKCTNDGTECCTRKPCTITTLGSIKLDDKKPVAKMEAKKGIEISGLKYSYAACVVPSTVTFEAFQKDSLGYCDQSKSLSAVTKFTGTPGIGAADMTLTIENNRINSKSLGAAYSFSGGAVTIELCVRARMTEDGQEVLFTENNFIVKYSNGGFSVKMKVDRKKNVVVNQDLGALFKVTAYQCNSKYEKITSSSAILQDNPLLRICVEGESKAVVCDNIVSATLKQSGNGIEDKIIVGGTIKFKYTGVSKQKQFCMLAAALPSRYFVKKTDSSSLQVVVEGNAAMRAARRQLKDVDDQSPDNKFEISVEIGESGGEPQSTTTWVMGKEVDKGTAVGGYNVAVGTAMIIAMLI